MILQLHIYNSMYIVQGVQENMSHSNSERRHLLHIPAYTFKKTLIPRVVIDIIFFLKFQDKWSIFRRTFPPSFIHL